MRPSSDITVFPRNRHTPFFKLFEHYKYFFLFGPNDTAKKKFISLYKDIQEYRFSFIYFSEIDDITRMEDMDNLFE